MRVRVIKAKELDTAEIARWRELQESNPDLASPYFCPEFTLAVGRTRDDAFVGLLEDEGRTVGLFPFQLRGRRIGKPIGWPLSDYHGLIASPNLALSPGTLLAGCGLDVFDFDHLLASQRPFARYHDCTAESPYLDLRRGYDHYAAERERAGFKVANSRMATKWRKLEREIGPLRYVVQDEAEDIFQTLLRWKSDQYRRSNAIDLFGYDWPIRLLEVIRDLKGDGFAGMLSTLYAGERPVAVHLGMRSRTVWHYWFPAYGVEFQKYSAGYRLIIEMAKSCESLGIETIDLGRGDVSYKQRLGSAATGVAQGFIARPSLAMVGRTLWRSVGACIERLPTNFAWNIPRRAYRRLEYRSRVP